MLKKKSLSILLLSLVLAVTAAVVCLVGGRSAKAEETVPTLDSLVTVIDSKGFTYSDDGTLSGFKLPDGIDGFFEVVIPSDVERIGAGCFNSETDPLLASNLLRVTIPAGVQSIDEEAFKGCVSIVEVCFEAQSAVSVIGGTELVSAASMVEVKDKSLSVTDDGNYLVVRSGDATSRTWGLVAYVGEDTEITLPAADGIAGEGKCNTYSIFEHAFDGTEVAAVTIPDCVTAIRDYAFLNCSALENVYFGAGITSVGEYAFYNCDELKIVKLNDKLMTIGGGAFAETQIVSVALPATLVSIGNGAFQYCNKLTSVTFAENSGKVTLGFNAFKGCTGLKVIKLPEKCDVLQYAFEGCTSLLWAYVGNETSFINTANGEDASAVFFPQNTPLEIIFPSQKLYNAALSEDNTDKTFQNANGASATYLVNITCYADGAEHDVFKRLHGHAFNFVCDEDTLLWNTEVTRTSLPAQSENYASTVWYSSADCKAEEKVTIENVNLLLAGDSEKIELYCHATVSVPVLPAEPVSWVQSDKVSYDINNLAEVLKALGCEQELTEAELAALKFEVVYADEKGNVATTPDKISANGVYSVTITLDPEFGEWTHPLTSSITVNVDTGSFNVVLIVFLVIGALAVVVTVSTAVIRKKVQAKAKRKQLSSQEILDKFRANGGETDLK